MPPPPASPLGPTYAELQAACLRDPLIAAAWAALRPIRDEKEDTRLITPVDLMAALKAALLRQAAIMRRDHADPMLTAEYERLAAELFVNFGGNIIAIPLRR